MVGSPKLPLVGINQVVVVSLHQQRKRTEDTPSCAGRILTHKICTSNFVYFIQQSRYLSFSNELKKIN